MADEIKLNYDLAEEMIRTFEQGREQLSATLDDLKRVATVLAEGGLVGRGGSAFVEAIQTKLAPSVGKLDAKFEEIIGDLHVAIKAMQDADSSSAQALRS